MKIPDDNFFSRADSLIHLANDQISDTVGRGKVSASFLYAVSRFNTWVCACECKNSTELEERRNEIIEYFSQEYNKMIKDNIDDYVKNFDKYMK